MKSKKAGANVEPAPPRAPTPPTPEQRVARFKVAAFEQTVAVKLDGVRFAGSVAGFRELERVHAVAAAESIAEQIAAYARARGITPAMLSDAAALLNLAAVKAATAAPPPVVAAPPGRA